MNLYSRLLAGVGTVLLAASTSTASAQEKITLRLADSLPSGHVIHELVGKPFSELVTKLTNGQVTFQHFPAEQLGKAKDMAQLTALGVADVSYIVPSYSSDKFPLTAVAELPGIFDNECQGSLAFYKVSHNGGILETREFAPNQLRPLVTLALPAYQVQLATSREIKAAKDLEGLKIRTTGGAMDLMMRSIGGVPVRMAAPEIYESLTRGTLDGLIFSYQSSASYDFGKLLKSGTEGLNFGTAIFTYSIGELKFKSLPENVRKALVEAGEVRIHNLLNLAESLLENGLAQLRTLGKMPRGGRHANARLLGDCAHGHPGALVDKQTARGCGDRLPVVSCVFPHA